MPRVSKAVFDNNVIVSAIVFGGIPRTCLDLARSKELQLYTSPTLLKELARVLSKNFSEDFSPLDIEELLQGLLQFINVVIPTAEINTITSDPTDNRVLEAATQAEVDFIVTGDKKHVLPLREYEGIRILSPQEFLTYFYER
jgi:putative PIN family toxin of toxin-antitoxin system